VDADGHAPDVGRASPAANEHYHVELKLSDPRSQTRIAYAKVSFATTNTDAGRTMNQPLPPMWGDSGLHYSANSAILGDGRHAATVTVDVPTFQRELKDKNLWSKAAGVRFHFKLKDGKVTEVSMARPWAPVDGLAPSSAASTAVRGLGSLPEP
jgi:uncharacterized protein involved in high-affinity Fe2+ transport